MRSLGDGYAALVRAVRSKSSAMAVGKNLAIRIVLLAVNFGTGVIVARSLGPTGRGEQAAIALWPAFIATMATIGLPTALNYHSRRKPEFAKQLYMGSAILMFAIGLVASAVGAVAMPLLLHGFDAETIRAAQWLMLFAPETLVASVARAHLESQDEFSRSTLGFLYPNIATLIALCLLKLAGHLTPLTGALSYLVPPAVQAVWIVSRLWQRKLFRFRRVADDMRLLLPYGLSCYGADIVGAVSSQVDLVVIVAFLSAAELGLYTVALSVTRLIGVVQASVSTILFSRASALAPNDAIQLVARTTRFATISCVTIGIGLLLVVPMALPLVYGTAFVGALPMVALLTGEAILTGCVVVINQGFFAIGRPGIVTIIQFIWLGTAFALLCIYTPRMNIVGAAMALLAAAAVRFVLVMAAYPVVLRRPCPNLIPTMADLRYLRSKLNAMRRSRRPSGSERAAFSKN